MIDNKEIKTCKLCFIELVETHENFCPRCCSIIEKKWLQEEAYLLWRYWEYSQIKDLFDKE